MHRRGDTSQKFQTMKFKNDAILLLFKDNAILLKFWKKVYQHNMDNLQCHTSDHPPSYLSSIPSKLSFILAFFICEHKVVTNFCKIKTVYIKVITLIFVVIFVVIIIIVNVAILFCFEILVVTA